MPRIAEKKKVLGGRGVVLTYSTGNAVGQWFYRQKIEGSSPTAYETKLIPGATSLEEAEQGAMDAAFALQKEAPHPFIQSMVLGSASGSGGGERYQTVRVKTKGKRQRMEQAVEEFLKGEHKKLEAKQLAPRTFSNKRNVLQKWMLPYLESKMVFTTNEIKPNTFDDYQVYRGGTTQSRKKDLSVITDFFRNYLVRNKFVSAEMVIDKSFLALPTLKDTDRMANPAIGSEDWKLIVDFVRDEWRFDETQHSSFFRNLFWHYILFAKNTGMSPEECLKLKWKQIDIVDERRINSKGEEVEWLVSYIYTIRSKTQAAREIPCNQARELMRWKDYQLDYFKRNGMSHTITLDTNVFPNPERGMKPFGYTIFWEAWDNVRTRLQDKLRGHRFSSHPYTLYSMRSSFIEDHLLKGTPVYEVATMVGHSVVETQKTYARLNLRLKGREISMPELGTKKTSKKSIDLFAADDEEVV